MNLGSNNIDFMKPNLTDHGVEGLFIPPLEEIEDPYDLYHDYAHNTTTRQICAGTAGENDDDELSIQTSSPGIILIVEAENATIDLSIPSALKEILTSALAKEGLVVVSGLTTESDNTTIVFIILREGYVVARAEPALNYCAFDIHFWSAFDKHEDTKNALVAAVGSKTTSSSSYRIIAGGMFGAAPSWKHDQKSRGPQYDEMCDGSAQVNNDAVTMKKGDAKQSVIDSMMGETMKLMLGSGLKVAVLSGKDSSLLGNLKNVDSIVTLGCPALDDFNEFSSEASRVLTSCEKGLLATLMDSAKEGRFNAAVIDFTADTLTASILLKVFTRLRRNKKLIEILTPKTLVVSAWSDESDDWRRNLLQLFKDTVFIDEPATYTEVFFDNGDSAFKLLLALDGEDHLIQQLNTTLSKIEEESGFSTDTQFIDGGEFYFQRDFEATQHFLPDDFNQTAPLEQWKAQKPLGHQVVFQMEAQQASEKQILKLSTLVETEAQETPEEQILKLSTDVVRAALENAIASTSLPGLELAGGESLVEEYSGLGDGCVLAVIWPGGSIVVLWDGKDHVDVNLFTYHENIKQAKEFEDGFKKGTGKLLPTVLHDEQPRGIGRVVSYQRDLEDNDTPHWA